MLTSVFDWKRSLKEIILLYLTFSESKNTIMNIEKKKKILRNFTPLVILTTK